MFYSNVLEEYWHNTDSQKYAELVWDNWSIFGVLSARKKRDILFKAEMLILWNMINIYKSITGSENLFFIFSLRTST